MSERPHRTRTHSLRLSSSAPERIDSRWPHIGRFLRIDDSTGRLYGDFARWSADMAPKLSPGDLAAAYEEWADFWTWSWAQREPELSGDQRQRHLVEKWTDSMTYSCRRSAAWARGEHPGTWIPQTRRRPDLHAESQAIVADIIAGLDPRHRRAGYLTPAR